jgi:predicted extracellular nuclease
MKKLLSMIVLLCAINSSYSQEPKNKEYKIHTVAFYNLENLFDTIDDISTKDEYSPILKLKSNKSEAYWNKIDNMARVISSIGKEITGQSPTLIGLCEIENDSVLEDLVKNRYLKNKGYSYINIPSNDWRGIDVALLYKEKYFSVSGFKNFILKAYNKEGYRVKTRDQLMVSGYLEEEQIHFIINHWPSQRGGQKKSEYLRLKSAELTSEIIKKIKEEEDNPKIIVMGDFNDDPTAKSFKKVLKTKYNKNKLLISDLYNPYEMLFKKGFGTLGFRDNINLFDQIILTSNFISENKTYTSLKLYKSNVYNPNFLITNKGKYKGYPFRSWSNGKFTEGFSDHFPVYVYLIKEK